MSDPVDIPNQREIRAFLFRIADPIGQRHPSYDKVRKWLEDLSDYSLAKASEEADEDMW